MIENIPNKKISTLEAVVLLGADDLNETRDIRNDSL